VTIPKVVFRLGRANPAAAGGATFGAKRTRPVGGTMGVGGAVAERAVGGPAPRGARHGAVTQAPGATGIRTDRAGIFAVVTASLPREADPVKAEPPRTTVIVGTASGKREAATSTRVKPLEATTHPVDTARASAACAAGPTAAVGAARLAGASRGTAYPSLALLPLFLLFLLLGHDIAAAEHPRQNHAGEQPHRLAAGGHACQGSQQGIEAICVHDQDPQ